MGPLLKFVFLGREIKYYLVLKAFVMAWVCRLLSLLVEGAETQVLGMTELGVKGVLLVF